MDLLLIIPPFTQLNTPYPSVPILTRHLRSCGYSVVQRDFSLELSLRLFRPEILRLAASFVPAKQKHTPLAFFRDCCEDYCRTIPEVLAFLQGKKPELAWRIAARTFLPEGPHFQILDTASEDAEEDLLREAFGVMGTNDQAKYLASLYFDDIAEYLRGTLDPAYAFGKYEEKLAVSLPVLDPLLLRLQKCTEIDRMLEKLTEEVIQEYKPRFVGLSLPFPGTLYGALRIARTVRTISPSTQIILGGGYVNSELRELEDPRIFSLADAICYDEGLAPLQAILAGTFQPAKETDAVPGGCCAIRTKEGLQTVPPANPMPSLLVPTYDGLPLEQYFPLVEMANPMHRIWTDGCWLKLQLTRGCYWHQCAFCDLALEYIGKYRPAKAEEIVDAMETLMKETGRCGFHFIDEAVAPALLDAVCREILRRGLSPVWWGNIRFDKGFTPELAQRMAEAGCIAVTGGLECANDRLLTLMHKGISLNSARKALQAFAEAGIYVHAYLMYGFPTETRQEALEALEYVRGCFADGLLQSAFWHRFALTAHSGIAANPAAFGIQLQETPLTPKQKRFARNEISYLEPGAPDWAKIGQGLALAVYNYMLGRGLDLPVSAWFKRSVPPEGRFPG